MGTIIAAKTKSELAIMSECGKKLGRVKFALKKAVKIGTSAAEIEDLAQTLIKNEGGEPSFKMVPGYSWATCINVGSGVVHGIPKKETSFKEGDVVSVDVGMFYRGFHTDSAFSIYLGKDPQTKKFLDAGRLALERAITKVRPGGRIFDISQAVEGTLRGAGYTPIEDLVGHGVGKALHEEPPIPCFTKGKREDSYVIAEGAVLAIEVMYTMGKKDLKLGPDGWTITTADAKIAALFEETVAATMHGPLILTGGMN